MPAKWARVVPAIPPGQVFAPGGLMLMATVAKKHITLFARDRRAPGAGSPEIKSAFTRAARNTRGVFSRMDRNNAVSQAMASFKGKSGTRYRRSRSKAHLGQRYAIGATGYSGGA